MNPSENNYAIEFIRRLNEFEMEHNLFRLSLRWRITYKKMHDLYKELLKEGILTSEKVGRSLKIKTTEKGKTLQELMRKLSEVIDLSKKVK